MGHGDRAMSGDPAGRGGGFRTLVATRLRALRPLGAVDLGLVAIALLMRSTDQTVLFFHLIFVLLAIGAFSWPLRGFILRVGFWVALTTAEVVGAVRSGATQPDELIEIPLLCTILLTVFVIARRRALAQERLGALERQLAEDRFRALVQHSSDIVALLDPAGRARYVSPAVERVLGYAPGALAHTSPFALVHPDDAPRLADRFAAALAAPGPHAATECRVRHRDGSWCHVEIIGNNLLADPAVAGFVVTVRDITERKAAAERLAHQAFHDPLTGLPNRALLLDRLGHALDRGGREGTAVALLLLDLDGFKHVNDSLGHAAGDRLLVAFARRLPDGYLRRGDTLARLGGDEFVILMEGVRDLAEVTRLAERLSASPALWAPYALDGREVVIRASIGVAMSRAGESEAADLLRDADTALYRAKAAGKGDYAVFDPAMNAAAMARLELESALRHAIAHDELTVAYQPLVSLADGRIRRVEALARWTHPEHGRVAPATFILLAEETGLIRPLGRRVLAEACRRAAAWRGMHGEQAPVVCVNLSAREFADPALVAGVAAALRDAGLAPAGLELEITEGVLMGDAPGTLATLQALKALGVGLAVDDFGTGYSSLAYLKRFPVDTLKVDRAFVAGLGTSDEDAAIIAAIVGLADALGLATVAEGAETAEQASGLRELGCTLAQGYHFARPLGAADLDALLAAGPLPLPGAAGAVRRGPTTGALLQRREGRACGPARPTLQGTPIGRIGGRP